ADGEQAADSQRGGGEPVGFHGGTFLVEDSPEIRARSRAGWVACRGIADRHARPGWPVAGEPDWSAPAVPRRRARAGRAPSAEPSEGRASGAGTNFGNGRTSTS